MAPPGAFAAPSVVVAGEESFCVAPPGLALATVTTMLFESAETSTLPAFTPRFESLSMYAAVLFVTLVTPIPAPAAAAVASAVVVTAVLLLAWRDSAPPAVTLAVSPTRVVAVLSMLAVATAASVLVLVPLPVEAIVAVTVDELASRTAER